MISIRKNKTHLLVLFILLSISHFSNAQIRATTESGNKVLLFDDGTWKYEEKSISAEPAAKVVAVPAAEKVVNEVKVDKSRNIKTEATTMFYTQSPRLVRYFGEEKGRIRCKLSCSNEMGEIRIHYHWDIQVGDGQRYFGFMKSGTGLIFHMLDGQKIELLVGEDSEVEASEKYNKSSISGVTQVLSDAQLKALISQPVDKLEVEWKKKPESYDLENPNYLMETLPTVF